MSSQPRPTSCFDMALAFVLVCLGLAILIVAVRTIF